MKKLSVIANVIAIALCSYATACDREDTDSGGMWVRTVEPRLSVDEEWRACSKSRARDRVVEIAQCGPENVVTQTDCEELIVTPDEALRALTSRPDCTDAAVDAFDRFAETDANARSDLVAAYIVRAQRDDRPSDFLHAFEESEKTDLRQPAALFNRALVLEALGFADEALQTWEDYLRLDDSPWAGEATEHRDALMGAGAVDAPTQWARNQKQLAIALRINDHPAVERLIKDFPSAGQRFFEEELLPQWAEAELPESLAGLQSFAAALAKRTGDRYALAVVEAIGHASPAQLAALKRGHVAYRQARRVHYGFQPSEAGTTYAEAAELLSIGGSPHHLPARLHSAVIATPDSAFPLLDAVEREARQNNYTYLLARILWIRGHLLTLESRLLEAIEAFNEALARFEQVGDYEGAAAIYFRRSGVYRLFGQYENAWRDSFQALRHAPHVIAVKERHQIRGEAANAALDLDHPRLALRYQNEAVEIIRSELTGTPPDDLARIRHLQQNLGIAYRERAAIQLHLEAHGPAREDLQESVRLRDKVDDAERDANNERALDARIEEVHGEELLRTDPLQAIAAFSKALEATAGDQYRTFRASLLVKRAEAKRRADRKSEAKQDLRRAIDELRTEERRILAHRRRGGGEELWTSYFSRFQDTYRQLIGQLMDEGDYEEAFHYNERARAFEPLQLILQIQDIPRKFRRLTGNGEPMRLRDVQAELPPGTFIIEYCVLEDRTYVWVISRDEVEVLTLPAGRAEAERWSNDLQDAAADRNAPVFVRHLTTPYGELLEGPLAAVAAMPNSTMPRLVFVPDGGLHGLPFAALRNSMTGKHLVQDAVVSNAGSATLYVFSLLQDEALSRDEPPTALLIGNPAFDAQFAHLGNLPGAESEVRRIRADYDDRAEVRIGAEATVQAFLDLAPKSTVVHVAAHAIANPVAPHRSMLLLARSAGRSGAIDAEELLTRLKLDRTKLVVLSTCKSAGGLPVGPEGVAPLVRPFLTTGVPAVIGSLWDVEDATADDLMVSFHRHYRQSGFDAAVALREAQIQSLTNKNSGLRSVLAWAPFQVIGHASPPSTRQ